MNESTTEPFSTNLPYPVRFQKITRYGPCFEVLGMDRFMIDYAGLNRKIWGKSANQCIEMAAWMYKQKRRK